MDSSFSELTHAVPGQGPSSLGAVTAGVGDDTGVGRSVTAVATVTTVAADRGRHSAPHSATISGNGGNNDSLIAATAATVVTPPAVTSSVVTTPLATAPAALTSRSGSGFFSSVHARPPAAAAAVPVAATTSAAAAAANAAPPPSSSQAPQAFRHSLSTPFSSSQPTDFNFHPQPSPSRPPLTRHRTVHAHRQSNSSSKLPAYRFVDLNRQSVAAPSLLQHQQNIQQNNRIPPSPVSPDLDQRPETLPNTVNQFSPPKAPETGTTTPNRNSTSNSNPNSSSRKRKSCDVDDAVSRPPLSTQLDALKSRASTFQPESASLIAATPSAHLKRSASLDTAGALLGTSGVNLPIDSTETIAATLKRRAPASTSPSTPSGQDTDAAPGGASAEATTRGSFSGQRELLLPKSLERTASDDRRVSFSRKPPLSYKPRTSTGGSASAASIPPIRSFRSSGERRSLVIDMNFRTSRTHDNGDDNSDPNHRDRTLRALEGRRGDEIMQWTPPDSAGERPDVDDSGDLFLKIAREDASQRPSDGSKMYHGDRSNTMVSRVARSARRPLSVAISPYQSPSYRSPSPPPMSRRMSEQESRARGVNHEQGERTGPPVSYRGHSREPHSEDFKFRGASTSASVRASPLTPRTLTYQDSSEPPSAHRRRQQSIDRSSAALSRAATLKQANVNYSHPRVYNSSPLVPQTTEPQRTDTQPNDGTPVEGTDSTTSTAAPSTVWDELEELKSRIHRLELTGKLPPTSSAAISRVSDERPPTAHTNATTLSASPKRGTSSSIVQSVETTVVPKDSHPLLNSALAKSKEFLVPEVYDALEAATVDALALAAMMGTAGQPGPISSGTSNIGSSTGPVTDRQLRKKADSVCRSLTELCLALSENATKHQQITAPPPADNIVTSPTITQFTGMATQRRPSVPANRAVDLPMSPRAASRYEEKRATILTASALPSPRQNSNVPTTADAISATSAGRKSSLLFSRTRRAGTEEPEDGRRTSTLLRSRRAGTEEPEDFMDRKPILSRGRRATLDTGDDDLRLRTQSRAITEVNGSRPREYISHLPPPPITRDVDTLANSALPRRRLAGSTTINTRLAQPATVSTPQTPSAIITPNRRYTDRTTPSREVTFEGDVVRDDRPQRHFSLARSGSLNRRATNRQSMIATPSNTTTSYYR